ncbi:OmpA family protein [Ideonella sp. TBM-1]|uniref:Peptidoglycan-associated lipoprotein n=1 Tax=Ideonella livida TaxID=2707176 RepID=A0A7C9PF55_9BURK|nr:OmpA family protein [Ideonella livida]
MLRRTGLWATTVAALLLAAGCGSRVRLDQEAPVETRAVVPAEGASAGTGAAGATGSAVPATSVTTVNLGASGAGSGLGPDGRPLGEAGGNTVYFDYDSFAVREQDRPLLDRKARTLLTQPKRRLLIEGHTDERGGREYNLSLGQKRAESVQRFLQLLGVPAAQLEAVSLGEEQPAVQGGGENAWARNRRAELKDR